MICDTYNLSDKVQSVNEFSLPSLFTGRFEIDQSELKKHPRKLTPRECARLQGFPENYIVDAVSDVQAYKQFGNSVTVPVIRAVATQLLMAMNTAHRLR